jgi:hypothetical protein
MTNALTSSTSGFGHLGMSNRSVIGNTDVHKAKDYQSLGQLLFLPAIVEPATQSLSSISRLQVWWAKVKEYEPLCVPKMVELGCFLFWIDFQVRDLNLRISPKKAGTNLEKKFHHLRYT